MQQKGDEEMEKGKNKKYINLFMYSKLLYIFSGVLNRFSATLFKDKFNLIPDVCAV